MSERSHLASAIAGFAAPMSKMLFFPLEMLKVQLIVSDGFSKNYIPNYRNPLHALMTIYRTKGFLELYKGCHLVFLQSISWSIYFTIYEKTKDLHRSNFEPNSLSFRMLTISEAALLTSFLTNPIYVIKTRVMLQKTNKAWYGEISEIVRKIHLVDGFKGFYAGLIPNMILGSNEALNVFMYELFKDKLQSQDSTAKTGLAGGLSKLINTILFFPVQNLLFKLQQEQFSDTILKRSTEIKQFNKNEQLFNGLANCIAESYRNNGVTGFYRGLSIQMLRVLPSNALFFVIYESIFKFFNEAFK